MLKYQIILTINLLESSTLNECLSLLTDKIDEIISPNDLTLDKLNKISALAKLIKSYADKHNNLVNRTYMYVGYLRKGLTKMKTFVKNTKALNTA